MQSHLLAMVSVAALLGAQTPHAFSQSPGAAQAPASAIVAPPSPTAAHMVTVPAGTAIPLTLINPIRSKSSKPGDAVRATVAFPVTVGSELAIPAGSYVEGAIEQVAPRARGTSQPEVRIHFTRLLFANGYSVPLDAENTQASVVAPDPRGQKTESAPAAATGDEQAAAPEEPSAHLVRASFSPAQQQPTQPTLPPLQPVGPSPAVITGAVLGGAAAIAILSFAAAHHHAANMDYVLFDAGWQFQIVLASPITIDASQAASAATAAAAH